MLYGRRSERTVLERLFEAVRGGQSGALVVRGEAGIGKTALLESAIASAPDLRVVRAAGVESEMELPFAGVHQLCAPLLDRLDRLPLPQRHALAITFGLTEGAVPDRFLVGLAVLSLLSEAAEQRPIACVVDDAQWLDRASAQAFGFAARRLFAESVVMLFAAREPGDELRGLPELVLEGLSNADAREVLRSAIRWPLDDRVTEQIVAETRGNPLALLELPRGHSPTQLAGGFGVPGALSLEGRIQESYLRRLEPLPLDTQRLLLLAAAEPAGDPVLLWRAAQRIGLGPDSASPAADADLVDFGERVRFRHPLVRSAVYRAAHPEQRRQIHRALADATNPELDPDRRAWHLAEASAGPDDDIAAELVRSAGRAQARGGLAAAAAFLARAAELTLQPRGRAELTLSAAQAMHAAGAPDAAIRLLDDAQDGALDEVQRIRVDVLRGQIAFTQRRGSDAPPLLLDTARRLEPLDAGLSRETYREAYLAAFFAGRLAPSAGLREVAEAIRTAPHSSRAGPTDLLLDGEALLITEGYAAGAPVVREALNALRSETLSGQSVHGWLFLAAKAALDIWDHDSWKALSDRHVELARGAGALAALPQALAVRAGLHVFAGEIATAASLVNEQEAVVAAMATDRSPLAGTLLAAWQGREARVSQLLQATTRRAEQQGEGLWLTVSAQASAVLFNGLGRYDDALSAARRAVEHPPELGLSNWALPDLVEAAVRCGTPDAAMEARRRMADMAAACGTDWILGLAARSDALLSAVDAAEDLYEEAIDRLGRTPMRADLARARLLYGEWLRVQSRQADARGQLRMAADMFTAMGAEAFAARAARELHATGERVRTRRFPARDELTAQETQIARLAADGLSNPEIGARLFISPRTVEYHLRKVFAKLGISSRRELERALPGQALAS